MLGRAKQYDVVVIGSGSGGSIVEAALQQGHEVAWVDRGPLGGTCAIVGCIPSKMLVVPADRVVEIREAERLGIKAKVEEIDFPAIMERMRTPRRETQQHMREGVQNLDALDFFEDVAHFVDERTLDVGGKRIRGKRIFLVSGARPLIPSIEGLEKIDFLTNDTVFDLQERPDSLVIVGGGYIACELGHFFSAMGTEVTIVQRNLRLVPDEEPEISELLRRKMSERMRVFTSTEVTGVRKEDSGTLVLGTDRRNGEAVSVRGQRLLVATGRKSNADLLQVENAGIETDARGYVRVNEFLETNVPNIWALGDAIGKQMYKHTANREAVIAWYNSQQREEQPHRHEEHSHDHEHHHHGHKVPMRYDATPHAVFTYPQIASVGLTEAEAQRQHDVLVGWASYDDVAYGMAMVEKEGFVKAVVDAESDVILGFHIAGPHAAILIQEVVNAMASGSTASELGRGMHIHPALSEVVLRALANLAPAV